MSHHVPEKVADEHRTEGERTSMGEGKLREVVGVLPGTGGSVTWEAAGGAGGAKADGGPAGGAWRGPAQVEEGAKAEPVIMLGPAAALRGGGRGGGLDSCRKASEQLREPSSKVVLLGLPTAEK